MERNDSEVSRGNAVAVDVPCPICEKRPVEEVAKAYRITGLLLFSHFRSKRFLGCHRCVRGKLWKSGILNLFLGWWCFPWGLLNPVAILWDFARGAVNRGPTSSLASALDESGVPYRYIEDESDFEPGERAGEEVVVRGLVRLGVAMMLADDEVDRAEAAVVRDVVAELSEAFDRDELEEMVEEAATSEPDLQAVLGGLDRVMTDEGKELAVALAAEVAAADEEIAEEEVEMIEEIADSLGVDAE